MSTEDTRGATNNLSNAFWINSRDVVQFTVRTPFIQRLLNGTLSDEVFSACDLQDRYFEHVVRPYRKFILAQENQEEFQHSIGIDGLNYHRATANQLGIVSTATTNDYIDFITANANSLPSAVVSLLPCLTLYEYLTQQLAEAQSLRYAYWIERHPPHRTKNNISRLELLMNDYRSNDTVRLEEIYRSGLQHEASFFSQFDHLL